MTNKLIANLCDSASAFFLDPAHASYSKKKQAAAWTTTALVTLATAGTIQAGCAVWRHYRPHEPNHTHLIFKKFFGISSPKQEQQSPETLIDEASSISISSNPEEAFVFAKPQPTLITTEEFASYLNGLTPNISTEAAFQSLPQLVSALTQEQRDALTIKHQALVKKLEHFVQPLNRQESDELLIYCTLKPDATQKFLAIFASRANKITLILPDQTEKLSIIETLLLVEESDYFNSFFGQKFIEAQNEEIHINNEEAIFHFSHIRHVLKLLTGEETIQIENIFEEYVKIDFFQIKTIKNDIAALVTAYVSALTTVDIEFMKSLAEISYENLQELVLKQLHIVDNPEDFSQLVSLTPHVKVPPQARDDWFINIEKNTNITHLNLTGCVHLTERALAEVARLPKLESLDLSGCGQITDNDLQSLAQISSLRILKLDRCRRITGSGLKDFASIPTLQEVSFSDCVNLTNEGLSYLAKAQALSHLNLHSCASLTEIGLVVFQGLVNLKYLNLSQCLNIHNPSTIYFSNLNQLEYLDLTGCDVFNVGLSIIPQNNVLKHLILTNCTPPSLLDLAHLTKLETLAIAQLMSFEDDLFAVLLRAEQLHTLGNLKKLLIPHLLLTDQHLTQIATHLSHLETLAFNAHLITIDGWRQLSKLSLRSVEIHSFQLDDSSLVLLQDWKELERFDLVGAKRLTGQGFEQLRDHPKLKQLSLSSATSLTDEGVKAISEINLEHLELNACKIEQHKLRHLSNLKQLKHIGLHGNPIADINFLSELVLLEYVNLENTDLKSIAPLKNAKSLTHLNLYNLWELTDEGLQAIKYFSKLKHLNLGRCFKVGGETLKNLRNATQLEELDLSRTKLNDAKLAYLACLTNLRELTIADKITSKAVPHLSRLSGLEKLNINYASIQFPDIKKLGPSCPRLYHIWVNNSEHFMFPVPNVIKSEVMEKMTKT